MIPVRDLKPGDEFGYPLSDHGMFHVRVLSAPEPKRQFVGAYGVLEMLAFQAEVIDRREPGLLLKPNIGDRGEMSFGPKAEVAPYSG
jgi:hypothetical protein